MHAVVRDVACDDESDRRNVQDGGVVGVGVADLHGDETLSLQLESLRRNRPVHNGTRRDLAREVDVPHLGTPSGGLFMHLRDRAFGGVRDGPRETLQQLAGAEPVIAVPVRGVDVVSASCRTSSIQSPTRCT